MDFENAVLALCQHPSFDHADLNPNQVAKLLSNLLAESPPDAPILDATQRQALIIAAQAKYGAEIVSPILQRILPNLRYARLHSAVSNHRIHVVSPVFLQAHPWYKPWCSLGLTSLAMRMSFARS